MLRALRESVLQLQAGLGHRVHAASNSGAVFLEDTLSRGAHEGAGRHSEFLVPKLPFFSCKAMDRTALRESPRNTFSDKCRDVPDTLVRRFQKHVESCLSGPVPDTAIQPGREGSRTWPGSAACGTGRRRLPWGVAVAGHEAARSFRSDGAAGEGASLRGGGQEFARLRCPSRGGERAQEHVTAGHG